MDEVASFDRAGFTMLRTVFTANEAAAITAGIEGRLSRCRHAARSSRGFVYAARNVLVYYPHAKHTWRHVAIAPFLADILGPSFGLVRALYFDKPPERTWALPWHQDLTVAVAEHLSADGFTKPTTKEGVTHYEAPTTLLERMATVRIHLDPVGDDNGPLEVVEGSHRFGKRINLQAGPVRPIHAHAGDCLVMRPLLVHASGPSHPETTRHRRILHLEFAADPVPTPGLEWHTFVPFSECTS